MISGKKLISHRTFIKQLSIVDALRKEGLAASDVNRVCITHSHIDHYRNIGMFPKAKTLEYFGLWDKEAVKEWQENITKNIRILKTPCHDRTSISIFVATGEGAVAICGDVFWKENQPETDPYATDLKELEKSRSLVLENADRIIPGHGPMYKANKRSFVESTSLLDRLRLVRMVVAYISAEEI